MNHIMIDVDHGSKAVHTAYVFEGEPKPLVPNTDDGSFVYAVCECPVADSAIAIKKIPGVKAYPFHCTSCGCRGTVYSNI